MRTSDLSFIPYSLEFENLVNSNQYEQQCVASSQPQLIITKVYCS